MGNNIQAISSVNNGCYDDLKERWYSAVDDPVALLRAESQCRNPWVIRRIEEVLGSGPKRIVDIGCGAGFLSNALGAAGHVVTGIDRSMPSLEVAKQHDLSGAVQYMAMDALDLGFSDGLFDVVCAMDFLEHVENPGRVIEEASRVLRPGGLFFFHTFNRTPLSWLIVIKGVEWFVKNTPADLHLWRLFIKPAELSRYCGKYGLQVQEIQGLRPRLLGRPFWAMLLTGSVPKGFSFVWTRSLAAGYCGMAMKSLQKPD